LGVPFLWRFDVMEKEAFESLIHQTEGERIDFKRSNYVLGNEDTKYLMVKDIICMSNTPRDSASYIVTGIEKHSDGTSELVGVNSHPDEADLQSQFSDRIYPLPTFSYEVETYQGKQFGVFVVPPNKTGPSVPLRDFGGALRRWQIYFRRGSKNDLASPADTARILAWFGKDLAVRAAYESNSPAWDRFLDAVGSFADNRTYVLIASPLRKSQGSLGPLGRIPWGAIFDFDPRSDVEGLLSSCRENLENHRSLHLVTLRDHTVFNLRSGAYWIFARGLEGRQGTVEVGEWRKWKASCGAGLAVQLRDLAAASVPTPVTFIVIWSDQSLIRHLDSALSDALGSFSELANFLIVTENGSDLQPVADSVGAHVFEMPLHHLTSGVQSLYPAEQSSAEGEGPFLPASSGAPVHLSAKDRVWVEEEIELIHLGVGQTPPRNRAIGRDFLRGGEVSWYELGLHYDIERDQTDKIRRQVENEIRAGKTARVNLYHAPGAGATTVARRLLWDLHKTYPCAILLKTQPSETSDRLSRIAALTGLPLVLLVDGAYITERSVEELYEYLSARRTPVVLLQVLRRFTVQTSGPRSFYLPVALTDSEAEKFAHVFSREVPDKQRQINTVLTNVGSHLRSAFYFRPSGLPA
jgi:hypothetical protein